MMFGPEIEKEDAFFAALAGEQTYEIVDGKLVIDGNGRYSGVKYADWDMERVKSVLDKRGTTYTVE